MKFIKYALILFIFSLSSCAYNFPTTTTTTQANETNEQTTIDLTGSDEYYSLLYGKKRIYNDEIKSRTVINTNIDSLSIDYVMIEYSIHTLKGNEIKNMIISKENVNRGFINDEIKVSIKDQKIIITTRQAIKYLIVTPIRLNNTL